MNGLRRKSATAVTHLSLQDKTGSTESKRLILYMRGYVGVSAQLCNVLLDGEMSDHSCVVLHRNLWFCDADWFENAHIAAGKDQSATTKHPLLFDNSL